MDRETPVNLQKPPTRRHFTDAARAAAQEARRRKRENPVAKSRPELFVVRLQPTHLLFGWEIRRFGSIILDRSGVPYPSIPAARAAGERALSSFAAPT